MSWKNPKVQAVLLGVFGILLVGFSIYSTISFFTPKNDQPQLAASPKPKSSPSSSLKTEKNEYFKIDYPKDWELTKRSVLGGGYIFYLKSENTTGQLNYQLEIEAFQKNSQANLDTLTKQMENFGYQKSTATFLNKSATKLEFTFPAGMIPNSDPKKQVKKEMYIIDNTKAFFRVSFIYYQDQNQDLKKLQEVANTFTIDQ
jgi:hypothetical protein